MSLKKKDTAAAAQATNAAAAASPAFEQMDTNGGEATVLESSAEVKGAVAEGNPEATGTTANLTPATAEEAAAAVKEAVEADKPATQAQPQAQASNVAVISPKSTAVAVTKKFVGALSELENTFDPASLDFNTFPRIVVGLDGFTDQDTGEDLGKAIGIEVLSFNDRFTLSPGVDDDDAKSLVRFSIDGKVLDCPQNPDEHGMPCGDYLAILRTTHGYADAAMKPYVSIYGFMTFANDTVIDPAERQIVGVQVPPVSRPLFDRYKINQGVLRARGIAPKHAGIRCTQEKKTGNGRKYAVINFAPEKDANIIASFVADAQAEAA